MKYCEVEEVIARYGFKGCYVFRPSLLLGERQKSQPAGKFAGKILDWFSFVFKGFLQKYKPIESRAVAFAMVAIAKEQPTGRKIFESSWVQASYDQR